MYVHFFIFLISLAHIRQLMEALFVNWELSFCQNETNWRQFWIFTALLSDGLLQGPRFGLLGNNVQTSDSCRQKGVSWLWNIHLLLIRHLYTLHWLQPKHISLAFLFFCFYSVITRYKPKATYE